MIKLTFLVCSLLSTINSVLPTSDESVIHWEQGILGRVSKKSGEVNIFVKMGYRLIKPFRGGVHCAYILGGGGLTTLSFHLKRSWGCIIVVSKDPGVVFLLSLCSCSDPQKNLYLKSNYFRSG